MNVLDPGEDITAFGSGRGNGESDAKLIDDGESIGADETPGIANDDNYERITKAFV